MTTPSANTTQFLTVNSLDLSVTSFGKNSDDVEAFGRGGGFTFEGVTYADKTEWTYETPPMTPAEADALVGWIKGKGHYWPFTYTDNTTSTVRFTPYSSDGGLAFLPSTGYTASSNGNYSRWGMMLHPGANTSATATFGTESTGLTASGWKKVGADPWELCSLVYSGGTIKCFVGHLQTTAFAWCGVGATLGYWWIQLQGENGAGSNATSLFAGWMMTPYAMATAMFQARTSRLVAEPDFPYVGVSGKQTRGLYEVTAKGFVTRRPAERVLVDGVWYPNAERLSGTLVQR